MSDYGWEPSEPDYSRVVEPVWPRPVCPACDGVGDWWVGKYLAVRCPICNGTGRELDPEMVPADAGGEE